MTRHLVDRLSTRSLCGAVCGVALACAAGCSTEPLPPVPGVDCQAEQPYVIHWLEDYEPQANSKAQHCVSSSACDCSLPVVPPATVPAGCSTPPNPTGYNQWYAFGDDTPGSLPRGTLAAVDAGNTAIPILPIPNAPCAGTSATGAGSAAIVFQSSGHEDWGSGFAEYGYGETFDACMTMPTPHAVWTDASQYEGIALWGMSPDVTEAGPVDKTVTIGLNDNHSDPQGGICVPIPPLLDSTCADGGPPVMAPAVPPALTCGNTFVRNLTLTNRWQLYLLPFSSFNQTYDPNRVNGPIDTTALYSPAIRTARGVLNAEFWLDSIGLYRRKSGTPDASTD